MIKSKTAIHLFMFNFFFFSLASSILTTALVLFVTEDDDEEEEINYDKDEDDDVKLYCTSNVKENIARIANAVQCHS